MESECLKVCIFLLLLIRGPWNLELKQEQKKKKMAESIGGTLESDIPTVDGFLTY